MKRTPILIPIAVRILYTNIEIPVTIVIPRMDASTRKIDTPMSNGARSLQMNSLGLYGTYATLGSRQYLPVVGCFLIQNRLGFLAKMGL